jgi:hypothetical protein
MVPFDVAEIDDVKRQRAQDGLRGGAGGTGIGEFDMVGDGQSGANGSKLLVSFGAVWL